MKANGYAVAICMLLVQLAVARDNFVANPGFDALYDSINGGMHPIYWTRLYGNDSQIKVSSSVKKEGYRALLLEDTGSGSVGAASDYIDVTPGFNYTLTAEVKCEDTPSKGCLYIRFYDLSNNIVLSKSTGTYSSVWAALSITVMAPEEAVKAEILCYVMTGADTGNVYFDNVALVHADDILANGNWIDCQTGALPPCWNQYNSSYQASIEIYDSENVMWLSDSSSVYAKGAYLELPASAGTPYILSADGKKLAGSDDGALWLYFLDSQKNSLYGTRARISSTDWDNYSVAAIAPDGTCYVKVLLYSSTIATGTSMFKGVELKEDYTEFYVSSGGTGTGTSYSDPALYTSSSFWSDVDDEAGSHPVKVVFKSGSYTSDNLIIQNMGDADNRIILEGEKPFETLFDGLYGIRFYGSQNMIVSNIHFCSSNAATARIAVGQSGVETKDITIDNCNFVDLTDVVYGVCSVAQAGTHDVTIDKCIFVRVGDDNDGSHMIYNSHDSYDINICNNYFEDGWGTYVKIRSGSSGYNISGNTFIQNNGYRTSSSKPFIHFSAINTGTTDEVLGTNYLIEDNYFEYNSYSHYPFWIYVVGDTPVNHPGYHEITVSEKNVIQSTAYSDSVRNSEILDNFGVDIVSDWSINNNTYYNASSVKFILGLTDPPAGFEAVSADIFSLID